MGPQGRRKWIPSSGPRRTWDKANIHNDVKTWSTRDHYPINAAIQEDRVKHCFLQKRKKKKWAGRPVNDQAQIDFKNAVVNEKGEDQKEALETVQKSIEEAAKKVSTTKSDRDKEVRRTPEEVRIRIKRRVRARNNIIL